MSLLDQITPAPRRVMTLFYIVDTSGSMYGEKIGSVNDAMKEAIQSDLPEISTVNDDAEIRVAILQFASGCNWGKLLSWTCANDEYSTQIGSEH